MSTKKFGVSFGCIANPIAIQLKKDGYKFDRKTVMRFEKMKDAIHILSFGGIITGSVIDNSFKKLFFKIEAHVCLQNGLKKKK